MRFLICYDVEDDRRRSRLSRLLEDHGTRVQYSVFECDLNEAKLVELRGKMAITIDQETDSIRIYRICGRCRESVEIIGRGPFLGSEQVAII